MRNSLVRMVVACATMFLITSFANANDAENVITGDGDGNPTTGKQKIKYNTETDDNATTLGKRNLKGAIKTVTGISYKYTSPERTSDGKKVDSFDTDGYLVVSYEYGKSGSHPNHKDVFLYDHKRHLLSNTAYSLENGKMIGKSVFKYDDGGHETERSLFDENSALKLKRATRYNSEGNMVERTTYTNFFTDSSVYSYSGNGYIMTKLSFKNSDFRSKEVSEFDKTGKCMKTTSYGRDGTLESITTLIYNSRGELAEMLNTDKDGKPGQKWYYKYDGFGNQTEQKVTMPGVGYDPMADFLNYKLELKYDKQGNISHKERYELKGGKSTKVAVTDYEIVYYR